MTEQRFYNPVDYGFAWTPSTPSDPMGWYEWDQSSATKAARKERDAEAKRLRKEGWDVRCYSDRSQVIQRGGIGSGRPHVDFVVTVFGLDAFRPAVTV